MNIFYIKEIKNIDEILNQRLKKLPKWIKKILADLKIKLQKFTEKDNIIILPVRDNKVLSKKKAEMLVERMVKKYECKSVVLSRNLNNNEILKNSLNAQNINILDGRYLFRFLIFDIIDFVLNKKGKKIQDIELSIMLNELDDINIKTIFLLAKNVKRLNIITNHIELFKKIEQKLYDDGIMIMVSNNKRKSLLKSDIVINLDFVEEILKEYKLNNNCIIINVSSDIKIYNKGFNGTNVNNYNIDFDNVFVECLATEFESKLIYESLIYNLVDFDAVLNKLSSDNVTISEIVGNKGRVVHF